MNSKWYLNSVLISILFLLWPLYGIPLIVGIILLVLKIREEKKQSEAYTQLLISNQRYEALLTPEMRDAVNIQRRIDELKQEEQKVRDQISAFNNQINGLNQKKSELDAKILETRKNFVELNDEIIVQEFGLYKPQYDFATALDYKEELARIRARQKEIIKSKQAVSGLTDWTVNGSAAQGRKMISDIQKLLLRAFNNECDTIISKVRYTNFDASLDRIYKSAEVVSKLGVTLGIRISQQYLDLKVKELRLAFEYSQKKHQEQEDLKAARAEQREQAKIQKEIEEQKKKIEKEQTHYQTAYEKLLSQLSERPDDPELIAKKKEFEDKLDDINHALTDIDYRQANMKAGYVYVISNIGSFGKDVYKIGMTSRLNPQDRIDELGDASVPFKFDVHAMIFSDDAPALEAALHRAFEDKKLNMVNQRREFFHVTLDEVKQVVKENFDKTVEFIDVPDAEQYRVSEKMREQHIAAV